MRFGNLQGLIFSLFNSNKIPVENIIYSDYIKVSEVQVSNTNGGTSTSGSWIARIINTKDIDTGNDCTINSNQITLSAGTYECNASSPIRGAERCQIRLFNVTDNSETILGMSNWARSGASLSQEICVLFGRFTITSTKTFEIQYRVEQGVADTGLGIPITWGNEVYTIAEFRKVA